jgi:hypothetical protein
LGVGPGVVPVPQERPDANVDIACGSWKVVTAAGLTPVEISERMNVAAFTAAAESRLAVV